MPSRGPEGGFECETNCKSPLSITVFCWSPCQPSPRGQDARNLTDYDWDVKGVDFANFQGSVVLSGTEQFAAIVILVRPDQFATLPVGKQMAAVPDLNGVQ